MRITSLVSVILIYATIFVLYRTPRACPVFKQTNWNLEEAFLKSVLSSQLNRVAVGVGILILAAGISVSVWLLQRDPDNGALTRGNEGRLISLETGRELTSLPTGNATVSDSAELDAGGVEPDLTTADSVTMNDSIELEAGRAGRGVAVATVSDSAELKFQTENAPAPPGGSGEVARFQDGADLIVRDAKGNIKQQETVK